MQLEVKMNMFQLKSIGAKFQEEMKNGSNKLVPALALDQRGIRLGYGGGWFDRLRSDPLWGAVPALAVLPAGCLVEQLPSDSWDVPFQGWLDEHGVHWLQAV